MSKLLNYIVAVLCGTTIPQLATRTGSIDIQRLLSLQNGCYEDHRQMHEFLPERETVTAYLERFQLFVSANAIAKDPTLLTFISPKHYALIRGIVSPALPKDQTYDQLVELVTKHYDPAPIVIAECIHFYRRNQK